MELIGGQRAGHYRCRRAKNNKTPPWVAPMTNQHYKEADDCQDEGANQEAAQCTRHMVTRVAVTVQQQANQTQILEVAPDKPGNDLTPGRIRFNVRDQIKSLRQCVRIT